MEAGSYQERLERLRQELQRPAEDVDLARSALVIASVEYPDLDIDYYLWELDSLADEVPDEALSGPLEDRVETLSGHLFQELRFHGDTEDYYNPLNSCLNAVLERRMGIPITLSLVYMETASRLGMPFEAIGLPGHLVVRTGPPRDELFVDPFNSGQTMDRAGCQSLVDALFEGRVHLTEENFEPYTKAQFLIRVLSNLKHNYFRQGDYLKAVASADLTEVIDPTLFSNIHDRAMYRYTMKQYRLAIRDLEKCLPLLPEGPDLERTKKDIESIWRTLSRLN